MICEKCKPRELVAMRALENLTPNGSEFVNDPERCVEFIRRHSQSQHRMIVAQQLELKSLRERVKQLNGDL